MHFSTKIVPALRTCPKRGLTLSGDEINSMKLTCIQRVRPLFGQALSLCVLSLCELLAGTANAQVVQLPSVRNFSYSGGAWVPDGGSASLAGNSYARSGSVSSGWGPYGTRASGSSFGSSNSSASVQIIDLRALDDAILSTSVANPNTQVPTGTTGRSVVGVSTPTGATPKTDPGKWQRVLAGGQPTVPVHTSLAEADIRFYLKMGQEAESANRVMAARVYYRMAVEAMTPEMQTRYAKIISNRKAALEADLAAKKASPRQQF